MKKRNAHPAAARGVFCAWLCAVLFLLAGCAGAPTEPMEATPSPTLLHATASPAPTLANDPAALYTNVLTDQRVISLVLEGYVNDDLMAGVLETLKSENVPAVFFFSGVTADEHADMVRKIAQAGFEIGNYGLNAQKKMEKNAIPVNLHQFQRGQELLAQATGETPVLFRCNGSVYTQELLQAAAYAGLQAGVLPNVFINHASFQTYADAKAYVQKLARGAVVSVKLGQALDAGEYEGVAYTMEYRAKDPPPMLSDNMEDLQANEYANITNVVEWLLKALQEEGYTILSPEALQAKHIAMFDHPATLDNDTLALLNADAYPALQTAAALPNPAPLPAAAPAPITDAEAFTSHTGATLPAGTVFVGDSITQGLQNYVEWMRESDPTYLDTAQFISTRNFSVASALNGAAESAATLNGETLAIPEALRRMNARVVFLMPGQNDVKGYSTDQLTQNLKLMIYEIRQANPGVTICLLSVPPGMAQRYNGPANDRIFRDNLALCKLCMQYGLSFADVAYPLRDADGALREDLCADAETYAYHLNDAGCGVWVDFLRTLLSD